MKCMELMDAYEQVDYLEKIMLDEMYFQEYRNDSGMDSEQEFDLEQEINRLEYLEDKFADYVGDDDVLS